MQVKLESVHGMNTTVTGIISIAKDSKCASAKRSKALRKRISQPFVFHDGFLTTDGSNHWLIKKQVIILRRSRSQNFNLLIFSAWC